MRIVKFSAENVKKLKVVEITPDGALVEVTGPNGSGKTSVLDAIFYALAGTADIPAQVVRRGEERAVVKLDLGELVVTRRFTVAGGTSLVVEAADGAWYPSPQKTRAEAIARAEFPVPGLSFGEGEVLLNSLPLANASGAEQLLVSVALAAALNPKLRVLRIKDGSLLDGANLGLLSDFATKNDFQIWIERVEPGGPISVVMEDGTVRM